MFYIQNDCLKIENDRGEIISLGGDDNCGIGRGRKMRLSVIFENKSGEDIIPEWLDNIYKKELQETEQLTVWGNPEKFTDLLYKHMKAENYPEENYLDDYICNKCNNRHEACRCD